MNGIISYVAFCDWLLLLRMFSRFIYVVACINFFLFYGQVIFHCMAIPHLFYPFVNWMDIWVVSTFGLLWVILLLIFMYKFLCEYVFIFLRHIPGSGIAVSYGNYLIWRTARMFSTVAAPFHIRCSSFQFKNWIEHSILDVHLFPYGYTFDLSTFVEKTFFSPLNLLHQLCWISVDQVYTCQSIFWPAILLHWPVCLFPFACTKQSSLLSCARKPRNRWDNSSNFVLFKDCFGYLGSSHFLRILEFAC